MSSSNCSYFTASQLLGLLGKISHKIIFSEFTLAFVEELVEYRYLDEVKVKGKNKSVKIYELLGLKQ